MELTADLLNIQGIFLSLKKTHGDLHKIKYKGGNEEAISNTVATLQKFLQTNNYIKNKEINPIFEAEIKQIVFYLILNTNLENPLNDDQYVHLLILPQLSKLLLAEIILQLDLLKYYADSLIDNFTLATTEELLIEFPELLKKCKPNIHLSNAFIILNVIQHKLSSAAKSEEGVEKLSDLASYILLNLTGLHGDHGRNLKIDAVYCQMGYSILNLLDLLQKCDKNNPTLIVLIEKLIRTCSSIMMAVTLDVFCYWAEIDHDNQALQTAIAAKAYVFIEKFQKYTPAKELISMLSTIAQKPKSLSELIHQADVSTMISMVNKADANQKQWFKALLNTRVFDNPESMECVSRWANLATLDDVVHLLNLSSHSNQCNEAKRAVIKCAASLQLSDLILATTRHFHQNGINRNLSNSIQQQITLLFNKFQNRSNDKAEFSKELHLLLLQNPQETFTYILNESLKNKFYTEMVKDHLAAIKEIATINDFGFVIMKQVMDQNRFSVDNMQNYIELFNVLLQIKFFSIQIITLKLHFPILEASLLENNSGTLKIALEILNSLNESIPIREDTEFFFTFILSLIKTYRCLFLEFEITKQEVVKEATEFIIKSSNTPFLYDVEFKLQTDNDFVSYYKQTLEKGDQNLILLKTLCPDYNVENTSECLAHLIKVLPISVTHEWKKIATELLELCGNEQTGEILCDCLVLLCHLLKSQESKTEEVHKMYNALKYTLQNFGIAIKECVKPKMQTLEQEVALTQNVCRLLKDIPDELKVSEGLTLINILSDEALKSLKNDKKFAWCVVSIKEPMICKLLGQKILA